MTITRRMVQALTLCLTLTVCSARAQNAGLLKGAKTIQVDPTIVSNPDKVKEPAAPNLVQDSLKNALRTANIEIGEAPIRARSSVTCHLVFQNADGKEIANSKIHVRGNLAFSPYEGNNTQRRQAVSSFEQKLLEEIEKLK